MASVMCPHLSHLSMALNAKALTLRHQESTCLSTPYTCTYIHMCIYRIYVHTYIQSQTYAFLYYYSLTIPRKDNHIFLLPTNEHKAWNTVAS